MTGNAGGSPAPFKQSDELEVLLKQKSNFNVDAARVHFCFARMNGRRAACAPGRIAL